MLLLLELLIIVFLFIGPSICAMFGWSTIEGSTSIIRSVHPILYLLLFYALIRFESFFRKKFYFRNAMIIIALIFIFRLAFGQYVESRILGNLMVPLLFSFFITELAKRPKAKAICAKLFITLFVIEAGLAIFERITHTLVFPYSLYNPDDINGMVDGGEYFRSNSLLGHPLSNALCVSVVIAFIATSRFKNGTRYFLLTLGFVALLCFNARFAILVSFGSYVLYNLFKNKLRIGSLFALGSVAVVIFVLVVNLNLGDRLLSGGVKSDDSSILARVDILEMLDHIDSSLIFKGSGLDFVEQKLGILHVENWLLIVLFEFGLLTSMYYVYLIFKMPLRNLRLFDKKDKIYILLVALLIASSNNSLATEVPVLSFIFAASLFIPYFQGIEKKKSIKISVLE